MTRPDRFLRGALLAAALCLAVPACGRKQEVPAETAAAEADDASGKAGETADEDGSGADAASGPGAESGTGAEDAASAEQPAESGAEDADGAGAEPGTDAAESASSEAEQPSGTEPVELTVVKHKQEGTHMVTAGGLTISVPTTFEGLEAEGAVFEGDDMIVTAGKSGSCRVRYKGSFSHIRINVKNNTEYDMAVRDCTVKGIEVGSTDPDPELTLYGIPMGATRQQIADVYGEPFSKTFDDENGMSNMVYQFGTDIYSNQIVMIIFRDRKAVAASYDDFSLVRR